MKIAIIHEVSYLNKPVYEYQDFAERLAALGHEITVLDFDEQNHGALTIQRTSKTGLAKINLISLPHVRIPIIGILWARYQFAKQFKHLLQGNAFDVILLYSVFINGTNTIDLAKQFGVPVIYRLLDAYHRLRKNPLQSWILRSGEKKIYRKATALLATNFRMQRYVKELVASNHAPCTILDHGVDTEHFRSLPPNQDLLRALGIPDNAIVSVFLGTTYSFSQLEALITQMETIRAKVPHFALLIVGAGPSDTAIQEAIVANHAQHCVFTCGMIDYAQLPAYLSLAAIALCPFTINEITREIIPIKILQYLASGLPVISTPLPDVMRHFPQLVSGVIYSKDDGLDCFIDTLVHVLHDPAFKELGIKGRLYVSEHYSIQATLTQLESILRNPSLVLS
ncbi:RfaG Glycosyltransferase [Burkholderiaceae bacterium]